MVHHHSYRYWKLNPDQATVDTRKSPEDPIDAAKNIVGSNKGFNPDHNKMVARDQRASGGNGSGEIGHNIETGHSLRQTNDSPV
jgi:hypothetical protein